MIATIAAIAKGIGTVLVAAVKIIAKVTAGVGTAIKIGSNVAGGIAIKLGASTATAATISKAVQVGSIVALNSAITAATERLPRVVAEPINVVSQALLLRKAI